MLLNFNYDRICKAIDFSEFIVYAIVCLIIAVYSTNAHTLSLFILAFICLSSAVIFYFDLIKRNYFYTVYTPYISTFYSGTLLSITNCNKLVVFSLLVAIVFRILKSNINQRTKLFSAFLVAVLSVFILEHFIPGLKDSVLTCKYLTNDTLALPVILTMTLFFVAFEFLKSRLINKYALIEVHQNRERLKKMVTVSNSFSRFVPDQLRTPIVKSAVSTKVFNKRAKLTVFFSDIVGFTELSDNLDADTLTEILNTYMECMTSIAKKHDAVLDKFIGDGMMCFFGAHGDKSDTQNALACVAMAMDMKRAMRELRRSWRERGFEGLYIRMGINTGYCHVGNFGSENRMSYTIIGKEVNLAARLEAVANPDQIVISKSTYDAIHHRYKCYVFGNLTLKGFDEEVPAWLVADLEKVVSKSGSLYDQNLPGFDIHLDFEQMKNYDFSSIKNHLSAAMERVEYAEKMDSFQKK